METNGNGRGYSAWERRLSEAADRWMRQTEGFITHIQDAQTKAVCGRVLAYIKRLRQRAQDFDAGIKNLYSHVLRQQNEIRELEDTVDTLQGQVAALLKRERQRAAREAVEALDTGEDLDTVLENLGRPEEPAEGVGGANS